MIPGGEPEPMGHILAADVWQLAEPTHRTPLAMFQ